MTAPKTGDRVRVVLEGVVAPPRVYANEVFGLRLDGGGEYAFRFDVLAVPVEVLPPPEPEWKPGDVVRSSNNFIYVREEDGWRSAGAIRFFPHDFPGRPLTRLVPEGQA